MTQKEKLSESQPDNSEGQGSKEEEERRQKRGVLSTLVAEGSCKNTKRRMQDTYKAFHSTVFQSTTASVEYNIDSHFLLHFKMTSQLTV